MAPNHTTLICGPVPTGLLAATIDCLLTTHPQPHDVPLAAAAFAIKLGYDGATACSLALRMTAAARMFADPRWSAIKTRQMQSASTDGFVFADILQDFIATAPLGPSGQLDIDDLARVMAREAANFGAA